MRLVTKDKECILKLEDKNSGELFAQCPIDTYPGVAIETVSDSSRYFVLRIKDDGGMLISISGRSHPTYWREEAGGTALRLMVDSKTALLEDESDPSQVRSPSPGKLVSLLVPSGSHVNAGQAIAELEVMKMYMPLTCQESGIVNFLVSPGTPVNAGDILAILSESRCDLHKF